MMAKLKESVITHKNQYYLNVEREWSGGYKKSITLKFVCTEGVSDNLMEFLNRAMQYCEKSGDDKE
jgi:hypothetical protein